MIETEMIETTVNIFWHTWNVVVASAPALLIGLSLAGIMQAYLPASFIAKFLGPKSRGSVLRAALVGAPIPLCSCSVIPVATELRRKGASPGATTAFLVSAPEIGVDSFFLSTALLGPFLAISRVITAFITAFMTGVAVDLTTKEQNSAPLAVSPEVKSCCSSNSGTESPALPKSVSWITNLRGGFSYAFGKLLSDLSSVLVVGFFAAGIISAAFSVSSLSLVPWDWTWFEITVGLIIALLISIPMYICATSATPLAAALLANGIHPAPVLVLLLAGPATNVTTVLAVRREFGNRALAAYVGSIFVNTLVGSLVISFLLRTFPEFYRIQEFGKLHDHHGPLEIGAAVVLVALLGWTLSKNFLRKWCAASPKQESGACCS